MLPKNPKTPKPQNPMRAISSSCIIIKFKLKMDVANAFKNATATTQRVLSEALRVLYAYPVFLVALGAIVLYTTIQCLISCR